MPLRMAKYSGGTMAEICRSIAKKNKFQSGFPSSLKQFSGPDLCKYSGSRPVWRLRPWHRAGSPEGGQEALQGVKFYLSF